MLQYALHVWDRQFRGYLHQGPSALRAAVTSARSIAGCTSLLSAWQQRKWCPKTYVPGRCCPRAIRGVSTKDCIATRHHTHSSTCCPSACRPSSSFALGVLRVVPVHTPRRLHTTSRALSKAAESGPRCVRTWGSDAHSWRTCCGGFRLAVQFMAVPVQ
jgi:hypothetical protein